MTRSTPLRRLLSVLAAVLLASTGVVLTAQSALADGGQKLIRVQDRCDKPTWDQDDELAGLCALDGGVTPARFRADLPLGGNGHWRFNNRDETVNRGDVLVVRNDGGEAHTFTAVEVYTGSCIGGLPPDTNLDLAVPGSPPPTLEQCQKAFANDLVLPGHSLTPTFTTPGTYLVQCMIHPWMRGTVTVR